MSRPYDEPAFPVPDYGAWQFGGASLGDLYAGMAMMALVQGFAPTQAALRADEIAGAARAVSNAMLAERTRNSQVQS